VPLPTLYNGKGEGGIPATPGGAPGETAVGTELDDGTYAAAALEFAAIGKGGGEGDDAAEELAFRDAGADGEEVARSMSGSRRNRVAGRMCVRPMRGNQTAFQRK
jgi:hypothetical protein